MTMAVTVTEPAWLSARREAARRTYESLPVPTVREEAWRYTNLRGFDPEAYPIGMHAGGEDAEAGGIVPLSDVAGHLVQRGARVVHEELAVEGIVFGSLARLAAERPELVERRLGAVVSDDEKFAAGSSARWTDGVLLHVPRGVEVELPLRAAIQLGADGSAQYYRALIVLEENASATFIEEFSSQAPGYVNVVVELVLADGARLEYVTVQDHHPETRQFGSHRAHVGRDARLDWVAVGLGGTRAKSRMETLLAGQGASVKVTGAYFLSGREHLDYDTTQEHAAPATTSDLFFKGALTDRARSVWRGVIRVDEGAQKTDAYQQNRNLLLTPTAHADSIPGLEIEANDVRCTHGATIGRVDALQLFYLMARGLTRDEAERLIVRGFFEDVLERIGAPDVREAVAQAIEARIPRTGSTPTARR
jgi:Fe-S cluster assembly protein SufD